MPASPQRKLVVCRMFPDNIKKLDAICVAVSQDLGRLVQRSELLNMLVEERHKSLRPKRTKRAGAAA